MRSAGKHFPSRLEQFLGSPGDTILSWQVKAGFQLFASVRPPGWTVQSTCVPNVCCVGICVKQGALCVFWEHTKPLLFRLAFCRIEVKFKGFEYLKNTLSCKHKPLKDHVRLQHGEPWGCLHPRGKLNKTGLSRWLNVSGADLILPSEFLQEVGIRTYCATLLSDARGMLLPVFA